MEFVYSVFVIASSICCWCKDTTRLWLASKERIKYNVKYYRKPAVFLLPKTTRNHCLVWQSKAASRFLCCLRDYFALKICKTRSFSVKTPSARIDTSRVFYGSNVTFNKQTEVYRKVKSLRFACSKKKHE